MSTPTPTTPKPQDLILVKGTAAPIYGIWPTGFTRQITAAEWTLWGQPKPDYTATQAEIDQLAAYDRALRA